MNAKKESEMPVTAEEKLVPLLTDFWIDSPVNSANSTSLLALPSFCVSSATDPPSPPWRMAQFGLPVVPRSVPLSCSPPKKVLPSGCTTPS